MFCDSFNFGGTQEEVRDMLQKSYQLWSHYGFTVAKTKY